MSNQRDINQLFDNQLWSVEKLSEYLCISVSTIRHWVYMRRIPFIKIGKRIRFRFEPDIRNWLEKRSQGCR